LATPGADLQPWLDFLTDPRASTVVLGPDQKQMYLVPPMVVPIVTQVSDRNGLTLDDKIKRAILIASNNPIAGREAYTQAMNESAINGLHHKKTLDNRIELNKILVAEGYKPIPLIPTLDGTGVTGLPDQPLETQDPVKAEYTGKYEEL